MNQQPDKLFREKLEGYHKLPPAAAWEKIAAAQNKKNAKGTWLKIAAALLLLAIASYLLWPAGGKITPEPKTLTQAPQENPIDSAPLEKAQEKNTLPEQNIAQESNTKNERPAAKKQIAKKRPVLKPQPEQVMIAQETNAETTESTTSFEELTNDVPTVQEVGIAEIQSTSVASPKKITLVYTAEEVNEYLDKKALAQATSDQKKPSTLKKLLKKANDLKNNQDPFGELRQKKNEILALNFRSERQRGQNK